MLAAEEREPYRQLGLLTQKPVLYVCNVDEAAAATGNAASARAIEMAKAQGAGAVGGFGPHRGGAGATCRPPNATSFSHRLGWPSRGSTASSAPATNLLGLITFFTAGPKEARAWTVVKGARAPQAARVIHSDFEKGFIRAETIAYADYIAGNGEAGAREAGKFRLEGKEYVVQDGDVMHFRFNV